MACAAVVAAPLWMHRWLPIQDLPAHLATLRVVHEVHASGPAASIYDVNLGRTQYVLFTMLGDVLAWFVSVRVAGLLILSGYMLAMVASMYALLRSLGRDPRLSLLIVPLLINTQFLLGLLQFLIGIPVMLYGWSVAVDYLARDRRRDAILLGVIAVTAFYTHVVIFGLFLIGLAVMAPLRSLRRLLRFGAPLAPSLLVLAHWTLFTSAGDFVRTAIVSGKENKDLWTADRSFYELYRIAFDTYRDSADERLFLLCVLVGGTVTLLARGKGPRSPVSTARWMLIPLISSILYFRSEGINGFLGHIRDRFSFVAIISLIPALRMPRGIISHVATIAMLVFCGMSAETFNWHCTRFEKDEVGDFDGALSSIPENKRVAGLIYETESLLFTENPFLHYVSYYLVERGGAVNYSFAGYPHWVYGYKPHQDALGMSPPVLWWEWEPEHVAPREELAAAYDYVITRGVGFDPPEDLFVKKWEGTKWIVWERR